MERTAVNGTALRAARSELKSLGRLVRETQQVVAQLEEGWPEEVAGVYVIDPDEELDVADVAAFVLAARDESPNRVITITVTAQPRTDLRR